MDYDTEKVLDDLLLKVSVVWSLRYPNKPGYLINRLKPEDRKAISKLKSDDLQHIRPPRGPMPYIEHDLTRNADREKRLAFDQTMKRDFYGNLC
jgi:hypothetical protein